VIDGLMLMLAWMTFSRMRMLSSDTWPASALTNLLWTKCVRTLSCGDWKSSARLQID